ncbi:MAG TPA: hypothetical protein VG406_29125 [Isosphaeraceae bacterium]|jgi:hypothetical protein|nr:hypothetical protein [Isosphaeraceae bacterium]
MRVVYQYFLEGAPTVARRLDFPILFSVATVRRHHPDAEVVVLDYSGGRLDWGDFPDRLGFRTVPKALDSTRAADFFPVHIHRPRHVWEEAAGPTVYTDCDVLWLEPLPGLDPGVVHIHEKNGGFFAFDPACYRAAAFLGLWAHACDLADRDPEFRRAVRVNEHDTWLHDESVYRHLWRVYPELLAPWVRHTPPELLAHPWDLPLARAGRFHMTMPHCGPRRGALAWLLRETQPTIERMFNNNELESMLGELHPLGGRYSCATLADAVARVNPP